VPTLKKRGRGSTGQVSYVQVSAAKRPRPG
jgi:hypothetical protein